MPILDQFETEPYVTYSGSYTDQIYYGSVFNDNYSTNRSIVALKTTGIISSSFFAKDFGRSEQFGYISGAYVSSRTQNFATNYYSTELIYNSLTPSPIGIVNANNQLLPYLATTSSWKQLFSSSLDAAPSIYRPTLTENAAHVFLTAQAKDIPDPSGLSNFLTVPIKSFANTNWLYEFPFQSKYKNLEKYFGTALDNVAIDVDLYSGSFISPPLKTNQLGSLFYAYGDGTFKRYVQYSQIWHAFGTNVPLHYHVQTKTYNNLQKIYYSNFSETNVPSAYVAFGQYGTIVTSSSGLSNTWETICAEHGDDSSISPNPYENAIQIDSWPSVPTGSIRDALAVGYYDGSTSGNHLQWLLIVEDGNTGYGKVVCSKVATHGTNKIPTKNQWEYIHVETGINLYQYATKNPGGLQVSEITPREICVVGEYEDEFAVKSGYIGYAVASVNSTTTAPIWRRNTGGSVASKTDVVWYSVTSGNSNTGATPTPTNYFWVCGADNSVNPAVGIIARASAAVTEYTQNYSNITPASPSPLPITRAITYDQHIGGANGKLICVGDNGLILTSTNLGTTWTQQTPAGSYSGNFVDVKVVYDQDGTNTRLQSGYYVIVGDDGEIQYSTNAGVTWTKSVTQYPNRISGSSGLGSSLNSFGTKNIQYTSTNRNNSIKNYYAGSIERVYNPSLDEPPLTMAVGGVSTHDFNEKKYNNGIFDAYDTVLVCKLADASGSWDNRAEDFLPHYLNPLYSPMQNAKYCKPTNYDYNKCFFGYGDGFSLDLTNWQYGGLLDVGKKGKTPSFLDWSPYDVYGHVDVPQFNLYGPQIRGWKYGLYGGVNISTNAIYRRGRYGQFRDRLEQRIFTKYITMNGTNPYTYPISFEKMTSDGPINVTFVTGTLIYSQSVDYVTATNPSYNPYDSGIYDYEYRSGQPFFDRGNED